MRPRTRIGFGWGFVLGGGCIDLRIDRIAPYSRVKRARHRMFLNFKAAPQARDIAVWWRPEMPLILAAEM